MEHTEQSEGTENAYRLDADIQLDTGWLDSLRVGVRRAERDQDINWSTYNWGSVQPLWGVQGDEGYFLGQGRWVDTSTAVDWSSNLVGGGVFPGGTFIHPSARHRGQLRTNIALFGDGHSNSWTNLADRTNCAVNDNSPGGLYCAIEQQNVTEDVDAAYVMLKFGGDETKIGDVSLRGNIGVRWVKTDGHGRRWYPVSDLDAAGSAAAPGPGTAGSHGSVDPDVRGRHRLHEWRHERSSRAVANTPTGCPA